MNAEWKARWVEALRSGTYKQTAGTLRSKDDRFCCLGVLCDIAAPDAWTNRDAWYSSHGIGGVLPYQVCEIVGADSSDPSVPVPSLETRETLSTLNDSYWSFAEIADLIELNL